jgi:ribosomal protein S26
MASWNLEFCSSCVVLLRNLQVPRRNSDSHLVFRDPTQLRAKNVFREKLAYWNLKFCNSCVVLLRNVQVPRRNSDSHLVFRDPKELRAKKRI